MFCGFLIDERQSDEETGASVGRIGDGEFSVVFLDNLLRHRKSEPCSAALIDGVEGAENVGADLFGNPRPVVVDDDIDRFLFGLPRRGDSNRPLGESFGGLGHLEILDAGADVSDRLDGVRDNVHQGAVDLFAVEEKGGNGAVRHTDQLDFEIGGARFEELLNVGKNLVDVRCLERRFAFLAEREHIENQIGNAPLILFDDAPPLLDHLLFVGVKPFSDQVASPLDPLENVLDVVRKDRDRLPDRRQTFRLEHGRVILGVFKRHGHLVRGGEHQFDVVVRQVILRRRGNGLFFGGRLVGAGRGWTGRRNRIGRLAADNVDIEDSDHSVAADHRHTDGLARALFVNLAQKFRLGLVGGRNEVLARDDVVDDRRADGHRPGRPLLACDSLGDQLVGRLVVEDETPPVDLNPVEDPFHDLVEQPVGIKRLADGVDRPVDEIQMVALAFFRRPELIPLCRRGKLFAGGDDPVFGRLDGRRVGNRPERIGRVEQADRARFPQIPRGGRHKTEHRAPEADLIAQGNLLRFDLPAVDVEAVGASQIGEIPAVIFAAQLGVPARDFRIVQSDRALLPPAENHAVAGQVETGSGILPVDQQKIIQIRSPVSVSALRTWPCPGRILPGFRAALRRRRVRTRVPDRPAAVQWRVCNRRGLPATGRAISSSRPDT